MKAPGDGKAWRVSYSNRFSPIPLVDASFLGISQGASFGAALAFSLGLGSVGLFGSSFGFSIAALAELHTLARRGYREIAGI